MWSIWKTISTRAIAGAQSTPSCLATCATPPSRSTAVPYGRCASDHSSTWPYLERGTTPSCAVGGTYAIVCQRPYSSTSDPSAARSAASVLISPSAAAALACCTVLALAAFLSRLVGASSAPGRSTRGPSGGASRYHFSAVISLCTNLRSKTFTPLHVPTSCKPRRISGGWIAS